MLFFLFKTTVSKSSSKDSAIFQTRICVVALNRMVLNNGMLVSWSLAPIETASFYKASSLQKAWSIIKDTVESGKQLQKKILNLLIVLLAR